MKRKDHYQQQPYRYHHLEAVSDDFSDFSLSSPPTKIRRLDAQLPPIVEEEELTDIPIVVEHQPQIISSPTEGVRGPVDGLVIEELPENQERAIVLFQPSTTTPLFQTPSSFSVTVHPQLISGFKNQVLWSCQPNVVRSAGDEAGEHDKSAEATNGCRAVVPWSPSQLPSAPGGEFATTAQTDISDMMDAEQAEGTTMDVEEKGFGVEQYPVGNAGAVNSNEGLHQWQQQHCMIPQPPQNTPTPIVWYQ